MMKRSSFSGRLASRCYLHYVELASLPQLVRDGEAKAAAKREMRKRLVASRPQVQSTLESMAAEGILMNDLPSVSIKQ
eukprot:5747048-Amphidinium_carterae.1